MDEIIKITKDHQIWLVINRSIDTILAAGIAHTRIDYAIRCPNDWHHVSECLTRLQSIRRNFSS